MTARIWICSVFLVLVGVVVGAVGHSKWTSSGQLVAAPARPSPRMHSYEYHLSPFFENDNAKVSGESAADWTIWLRRQIIQFDAPSWSHNAGMGWLEFDNDRQVLRVFQSQAVHDSIHDFLSAQYRRIEDAEPAQVGEQTAFEF